MSGEILVATDFSETAAGALRVGLRHARALGARVHLLHVASEGEADVTRPLAEAAAQAGPDVPAVLATSVGDPAPEIVRYATRHPIDLIVVGTHGRTGVSRVLLGSVAERVMRGAPCPVLVVPPGAAPAPPASSAAAVEEDEEPSAAARPCLVCATPTRDLICATCRARIRGEALERKRREERPGRT
jgi:nucleotide-binding universal stress UspA family protein